jgi:uncharacterized protein
VLIILGVMLVSRMLTHRHAARKVRSAPAPAAKVAAESMVRCAHCQVYLPRSEAFMSQGKTWCSAEHAQLGLHK